MKTQETTLQFHVALGVRDLERSTEFYRTLFGIEPSKVHDDYVRFTPEEPPLVLSLNPLPAGATTSGHGGVLHLGLRFGDASALQELGRRLEAAELPLREGQGTTCCYAVKDELWVKDPDGNEWELYLVTADAEVHSKPPVACCAPSPVAEAEAMQQCR